MGAEDFEKALFTEFYDKIGFAFILSPLSRKFLLEPEKLDVNSEALYDTIRRNQYLEYILLEYLKTFGLKEAAPELKTVLSLLGINGLRNFITALYMRRTVEGLQPEFDAAGKLDFKLKDYLRYSVKTEEWAQSRFLPFSEMAFPAGFVFDMITLIAKVKFGAKDAFFQRVDEVYKHGMIAARIGNEIGQQVKSFNLSRYTFSACLVHDVGKLVMELLFPQGGKLSYPGFRDQLSKVKFPVSRDVRTFLEAKKFMYGHEFWTAQIAMVFAPLRPVEKALLYHHDCYIAKNSFKDQHMLGGMIALATNIATHFRNPKDLTDPIINKWLTVEIRDLGITKEFVVPLVRGLLSESARK